MTWNRDTCAEEEEKEGSCADPKDKGGEGSSKEGLAQRQKDMKEADGFKKLHKFSIVRVQYVNWETKELEGPGFLGQCGTHWGLWQYQHLTMFKVDNKPGPT